MIDAHACSSLMTFCSGVGNAAHREWLLDRAKILILEVFNGKT